MQAIHPLPAPSPLARVPVVTLPLYVRVSDDGLVQHPEKIMAKRREEARLLAERGPGAYNPVMLAERRSSAPIITPVSVDPYAPPLRQFPTPPQLTCELPTPEFAERLARAQTYTSALRSGQPLAESSRSTSVSSPRKRSVDRSKKLDHAAAKAMFERMHGESTRSILAARNDRTEQQRSLQWGSAGGRVLF